jgi:hypothetical protein
MQSAFCSQYSCEVNTVQSEFLVHEAYVPAVLSQVHLYAAASAKFGFRKNGSATTAKAEKINSKENGFFIIFFMVI